MLSPGSPALCVLRLFARGQVIQLKPAGGGDGTFGFPAPLGEAPLAAFKEPGRREQ